jgi:hypothetical protein
MATFNLKKGWIKMTKKELDDLRQRVHKQYITDGGSHKMEDF